MIDYNSLSKLSSLEQIQQEKLKIKRELRIQERQIKDSLYELYESFSIFSTINSFIKTITSSFTMINGLRLGIKLFSFIFKR